MVIVGPPPENSVDCTEPRAHENFLLQNLSQFQATYCGQPAKATVSYSWERGTALYRENRSWLHGHLVVLLWNGKEGEGQWGHAPVPFSFLSGCGAEWLWDPSSSLDAMPEKAPLFRSF